MSITSAVIILLFFVSLNKNEQALTLPFVLLIILIAIVSTLSQYYFNKKRKNNILNKQFWNKWGLMLIITSGLAWFGLNTFVFNYLTIEHKTLLLFSTAGVMSGATVTYPTFKKTGALKILLLGFMLIYNTANSNNAFPIEFSAMFILFTIVMVGALYGNFSIIAKSVKVQSDHIQLESEKTIAINTALAKDEFLANMSHEIRTPMNAIMGLSNLLYKNKNLDEKQSKYINAINLNSKNLLGIINDILDFSKIEAGKLELANYPFNLKENLDNLLLTLSESANTKNISLNLNLTKEINYFIIGDWIRLNQILTNLIANAIKFTNKGEVNININVLSETSNEVTINFSVTDTGIGIKPENIEKIHAPFTQENSNTTREFGGTGLGLSIVNSLIKLHNSKLNVKSIENLGSEFSFEIIFEKVIDSKTKSESIKSKNILIIDCDDFNRQITTDILSETLKTKNISSTPYTNKATYMVKVKKYDIILIDLDNEELNNATFIDELQSSNNYNSKLYGLYSLDNASLIEQLKDSDIDHFISKPFTNSELIETLS